jgi:cytochrome d ubiquinol oxidase subunit II
MSSTFLSALPLVFVLAGVVLYAVLAGADLGAGFWQLFAGRGQHGEEIREHAHHSMAPVWEANHVWLIFILVVLWTAFPSAFYAVMTTLYVPITVAAFGIILRGSGFAFRKSIEGLSGRRAAGATFAISSLLTPFFMGTVVGAIAAGNVPADGNGDAFSSWLQPLPLLVGAIFVVGGAYLAAVFLVGDAHRAGDAEMERYFERRALGAAVVAGALAVAGIFLLNSEAGYVHDRLLDEGLPLVILSLLCGAAAIVVLVRGGCRPLRPLAAGAFVAVIWGWAVAQLPYLLPTSLRIDQAAAPDATLTVVLIVFGIAAVLVLPSLGLLYTLAQKDLLESEH